MRQTEMSKAGLERMLADVVQFTRVAGGLQLRGYQQAVARAVIGSVREGLGQALVVMFPRQSGKNELQARLQAYLLFVLGASGAEMVMISPTYQPQCLNAMRRLERALEQNQFLKGRWEKRAGNLYRYRNASLQFLSAAPGSNIVGATASTLLMVDEAQDVLESKYDREIAPMAASTNATRVFWGTAWTSQTLLARELRLAQAEQERDGLQRVFRLTADAVCAEVPAYGTYVAGQVARMGRAHPMVRTQYYSEEIDAEGSLFTPTRIALMQGLHPFQDGPLLDGGSLIAARPWELAGAHSTEANSAQPGVLIGGQPAGAGPDRSRHYMGKPVPGRDNGEGTSRVYAMLLDVAGEDEAVRNPQALCLANPARDATALTIVEVDLQTVGESLIRKPTYRVVHQVLWVGESHTSLYVRIRALADSWQARYLVVDASGVGAGLASFLAESLGKRVLPVVFNAAVKSRLGWSFLAVIDSGRFKLYAPQGVKQASLASLFFKQAQAAQYTVRPGPEKQLSWGVPDGARDPADGSLLHDDLLLSAALVAVLDEQTWGIGGGAIILPARDPLREMEGGY